VARLTFTVRQVEKDLGVSYARANKVVEQLMGLGIIEERTLGTKARRFFAPLVFEVLTRDS
jgi:predicted transcriptional regulator